MFASRSIGMWLVIEVLLVGMVGINAWGEHIYVKWDAGGGWIDKPATIVGGPDGFYGNICVALFALGRVANHGVI